MPSPDALRSGSAVVLALSLLLGSSCGISSKRDPRAVHEAESESLLEALPADSPPPGALRVRLAFVAGADLDLFVTDPAHETVYFANSPSRSGGRLARDVRCGDPEPRVETVVFPDARPGRYRVGVDYPKTCDGHDGAASFVVVVDGREPSAIRPGVAAPGIFQPVVLEVEAGPTANP